MCQPRQLIAPAPPRAKPHHALGHRNLLAVVREVHLRRLHPHLRRLLAEDEGAPLADERVQRQHHQPRFLERNGTLDELVLELVRRVRDDVVVGLFGLVGEEVVLDLR